MEITLRIKLRDQGAEIVEVDKEIVALLIARPDVEDVEILSIIKDDQDESS